MDIGSWACSFDTFLNTFAGVFGVFTADFAAVLEGAFAIISSPPKSHPLFL
jgi:hypothetical protein